MSEATTKRGEGEGAAQEKDGRTPVNVGNTFDALNLSESEDAPKAKKAKKAAPKEPEREKGKATAAESNAEKEPKAEAVAPPNVELTETDIGEYCLVDTPEKARQAMRYVNAFKLLAVDCEGVNLGRAGKLCLVQVATPNKMSFLFDVVDPAMMKAVMDAGLKRVLESKTVVKIFHDCRADSDALFHIAGVTLANVWDLQLAHAILERSLSKPAPIPIGLAALIRRYGKGAVHESKDAVRAMMDAESEFWVKRPIPQIALEYACTDVLLLHGLQKTMERSMSRKDKDFVKMYSEAYASMVRGSADGKKVRQDDVPLYGIPGLDTEVIAYVESLKRRNLWRGNPKDASTKSTPQIPTDIAVAAAAAASSVETK